MNCGRCGRPMEEGRVEVHRSPGAFLFQRWAAQDLYWYDGNGRRRSRRRVVDSDASRLAYGCRPCGLITIDTTAPQALARRGRWRGAGASDDG